MPTYKDTDEFFRDQFPEAETMETRKVKKGDVFIEIFCWVAIAVIVGVVTWAIISQ